MPNHVRYGLSALLLILLTGGCYQRVISERSFPGMAATRTETTHDYTDANARSLNQFERENAKPFDPIGDLIIKPIGGVANSIGNAFSGPDEPDPKAVQPPARPATSISDLPPPPPEKEE